MDDNIQKSFDFLVDFNYGESLEKAKKNIGKLVKKRVVDKRGKATTVYVDPNKDKKKLTSIQFDKEAMSKEPPASKKSSGVSIDMNDTPSRTGRHSKLYGLPAGTAVEVKIKGKPTVTSLQYWNVNNSTPDGYAVVMTENGDKYERKISSIKVAQDGAAPTKQTVANNIQSEAQSQAESESIYKMDVNQRFATFTRMVKSIASGMQKSLISYGSGGVGKTYTVTNTLESQGKVPFDLEQHMEGGDGYDYVKITGKLTPAALYKNLFMHNRKIVVFDDCDGFLKDDNAVNLLKGALDTSGDGTISYGTSAKLTDDDGNDIPKRFKFKGQAIFITNLPTDKVPQPIKSRSLRIDMTMSPQQTIDRIAHILDYIDFKLPGVTKDDKQDALKFLKDHMHVTSDLNVRTLGSLLTIKKTAEAEGVDWKRDAKSMILSKASDDFEGIIVNVDEYVEMRKGNVDIDDFQAVKVVNGDQEKIAFVSK